MSKVSRLRTTAIIVARIIIIAGVSFFLAAAGSKLAEMRDCWNCTPGLALAEEFVPDDPAHGFDVFFRRIEVGVSIDALLWFAVLSGATLVILAVRRRRESPFKRD